MSPITSIFIPHVEKFIGAEYIANALDKFGIAVVSKIAIEPYQGKHTDYNKAFIDIKNWHDTESAFGFIERLKNPNIETRFIHSEDDWWVVEINKFPEKTDSNHNTRELTIFRDTTAIDIESEIYDYTSGDDMELEDDHQAAFYGYKSSDDMELADDFESIIIEAENQRYYFNQ